MRKIILIALFILCTLVPASAQNRPEAGANFFAVKRANITNSSVNIAFGFTSRKVIVETAPANADELCVDWKGGTAVCPSANVSGDDTIAAGRIITFDSFGVSSISVIAASGTLTVYVRAYN